MAGKRPTLKCHGCGNIFKASEVVSYCRKGTITPYNYCQDCLIEAQWYEKFVETVCRIFHLQAPGPRINREHKVLKEKGYTEQTITECLQYVYDIKKIQPKVATLYFVNPEMIDEMNRYKRINEVKTQIMTTAIKDTKFTEYIVPIREAAARKKETINPDDYLDYFNSEE